MKSFTDILISILASLLTGLFVAYLLIFYKAALEKLYQRNDTSYLGQQFLKGIARLLLYLLSMGLLVSVMLLFIIKIVRPIILHHDNNDAYIVISTICGIVALLAPIIKLRKRAFREINTYKLRE